MMDSFVFGLINCLMISLSTRRSLLDSQLARLQQCLEKRRTFYNDHAPYSPTYYLQIIFSCGENESASGPLRPMYAFLHVYLVYGVKITIMLDKDA